MSSPSSPSSALEASYDETAYLQRLEMEAGRFTKKDFDTGFQSALLTMLHADQAGITAWIIERGELPPMRQKVTCLLTEMLLLNKYGDAFQCALDLEAEATWTYMDVLARRSCELQRRKAQEVQQRAIAAVVAKDRRTLEAEERSVRATLEESFLQSLRLVGREMKSRRSLLSTREFQAQKERVSRHLAAIVDSAQLLELDL